MRTRTALALLALPLALAACGGGGGGGASSLPATANPGPGGDGTVGAAAIVRGTVVDEDSNAPLAGVRVALAKYVVGAPAFATTTTAADGTFALGTATPDWYLLTIGSDSPSDSTRATLHLRARLTAGTTTIYGPTPASAPDVSYLPSQQGGLRLARLSSDEAACLTAAQNGRAALKLPPLIEDELLLEDARAKVQEMFAQDTDLPSPLYADPNNAQFIVPSLEAITHSEQDFPDCPSWSGVDYSYRPSDPYTGAHPPYPQASNAAFVMYGTAFRTKGATSISHASYGAQNYGVDPRT